MSAEKDIVNFWCHKKGFFTVSNLKDNNKDIGVLAANPKKKEILHIQVSCSLTGIIDSKELGFSAEKIASEKFFNKSIERVIEANIDIENHSLKRVLVLGAMPKTRKAIITSQFEALGVAVIEFENVLYELIESLDTQYYKNDIIRTLQLVKFLLLREPAKMAKLAVNDSLSSNSRKEFLSNLLENEQLVREFKKTNKERLGAILKNSGIKATELAVLLGKSVLNKRTMKLFMDSLAKHESERKDSERHRAKRKNNMVLGKFFN